MGYYVSKFIQKYNSKNMFLLQRQEGLYNIDQHG